MQILVTREMPMGTQEFKYWNSSKAGRGNKHDGR